MFFCDECREKNNWPESMFASRGRCEVCGKEARCNDVPSSQLPKPPRKPDAPAFSCTLAQIMDAGLWMEYCAESGRNEWFIKEGGDDSEVVKLPLTSEVAKAMFGKFTAH